MLRRLRSVPGIEIAASRLALVSAVTPADHGPNVQGRTHTPATGHPAGHSGHAGDHRQRSGSHHASGGEASNTSGGTTTGSSRNGGNGHGDSRVVLVQVSSPA